jgi:hypothetical protein
VWSIAGVGDFNADSKPDLIWENTTTGDRSIWFMDGSTWNGSYAALPQVPAVWRIAAAGDFNADAKTDLVWQNVATGERSIWFMNAAIWNGSYASLLTVPAVWRITASADFDGDSDQDLVWQNTSTGERSVWLMTGSTWSGSYASLPTIPTAWSIAGILAAPPAPTTGAVKVVTVTTGTLPDPTGYTLTVSLGGGFVESTEIGINGFRTFTRSPGSYTVTLGGIASNCTTTGNPRTVTVTAGVTTEETFNVSCPAPLTPAPPTSLTAIASATGVINLSWSDNSSNETGFRIEQCTGTNCSNFVELGTVGANAEAEPITGVLAGTSYTYRVRAYNAQGNSSYSNTSSATGAARRIRVINNGLSSLLLRDIVRLKLAPSFAGFGDTDLLSDDRLTTCQDFENFDYISPGGTSRTFNQTIGQTYAVFLAMGVWQPDGGCFNQFAWSRRTSFQQTTSGPLLYVYVGISLTGHTSGTVDFNVTGSYLAGTMRVQVSQGGVNWGSAIPFIISQ